MHPSSSQNRPEVKTSIFHQTVEKFTSKKEENELFQGPPREPSERPLDPPGPSPERLWPPGPLKGHFFTFFMKILISLETNEKLCFFRTISILKTLCFNCENHVSQLCIDFITIIAFYVTINITFLLYLQHKINSACAYF